jgi:hypothetical protein
MDSEFIILIVIAAVVAVATHAFVRRFWLACLIVTLLSPALYAVQSFVRLNLPPAKLFWLPFLFLQGGACALAVAMILGLPFWLWRRRLRR